MSDLITAIYQIGLAAIAIECVLAGENALAILAIVALAIMSIVMSMALSRTSRILRSRIREESFRAMEDER